MILEQVDACAFLPAIYPDILSCFEIFCYADSSTGVHKQYFQGFFRL